METNAELENISPEMANQVESLILFFPMN